MDTPFQRNRCQRLQLKPNWTMSVFNRFIPLFTGQWLVYISLLLFELNIFHLPFLLPPRPQVNFTPDFSKSFSPFGTSLFFRFFQSTLVFAQEKELEQAVNLFRGLSVT